MLHGNLASSILICYLRAPCIPDANAGYVFDRNFLDYFSRAFTAELFFGAYDFLGLATT